MRKLKIPDTSDRIASVTRHPAGYVVVVWRPEVISRYGAPYPTIAEKLRALDEADAYVEDLSGTLSVSHPSAQFPYPGGSWRRCIRCAWPSEKPLCGDCYVMSRYAIVLDSTTDSRGGAKIRRKASIGEISAMEQRCEQLSQMYAELAAALAEHGRNRGDSQASLTSDSRMFHCETHPSEIRVAVGGYTPTCSCERQMVET